MPALCSPPPHPVRSLLNRAGMICRQLSLAYQEDGPTYAALQQAAREIEALPHDVESVQSVPDSIERCAIICEGWRFSEKNYTDAERWNKAGGYMNAIAGATDAIAALIRSLKRHDEVGEPR